MNKVFLIGRLTRDPEIRYTSNNLATLRTSLAVDRQFARDKEERGTDFINIVAFAQRAETMSKYLTKGSQIAIDGHIQTGSYDDKDGKKVYTTDIIIDNFQFLDSKNSRTNASDENQSVTPYDFPKGEEKATDVSSDPFADFGANVEISDNDLPF